MSIINGSDNSYTLDLTFFVPCYNEAGNIRATVDTILTAMHGSTVSYEILMCDDSSEDNTKEIIDSIIIDNKSSRLRLVANDINRGLGFNYFRCAFLAHGKHYMLINGDNVEPSEAIKRIVHLLGKRDMIIPYFGKEDKRSLFRRSVSRFFSFLINVLGGHRVYYYNGPVLHQTDNVRFFRSETHGYGYQAELICRLLHENISYEQVAVPNADREWGFSKAFSIGNILSVCNSLFHIFVRRLEYASVKLLTKRNRKN
jgi:glycosyltransferase involved in cell wall biosynthesis